MKFLYVYTSLKLKQQTTLGSLPLESSSCRWRRCPTRWIQLVHRSNGSETYLSVPRM